MSSVTIKADLHADDCPVCGQTLLRLSCNLRHAVGCARCQLATLYFPTEVEADRAWAFGEWLTSTETVITGYREA